MFRDDDVRRSRDLEFDQLLLKLLAEFIGGERLKPLVGGIVLLKLLSSPSTAGRRTFDDQTTVLGFEQHDSRSFSRPILCREM